MPSEPVTTESQSSPQLFEQLLADLSAAFVNLQPGAVDGRIDHALERVAHMLAADRGTVSQIDVTDGVLRITHQWVRDGFVRLPETNPRQAFPWLVSQARQGNTVLLRSLADLPTEAVGERAIAVQLGLRSFAMIPLAGADTLVGALTFGAVRQEQPWTEATVSWLRLVAEVITSALARKRAQVQLDQMIAFERLIADLSATFVDLPAPSVDDHITAMLGHVAEVLDLDRNHVVQRSLEDGNFYITHQWARQPEWSMPEIIPAETLPWLVDQTLRGNTVIFSHVDELPPEATGERKNVARYGAKSFVSLPLTAGGEVIGALGLSTLRARRTWHATEVDRFRLVARIVAGAIARKRADIAVRAALDENERLRTRLEAENAYFQSEVKTAHDFEDIVGRSPALRAVLHKIDQVAPTDVPVLLLGDTGTGKELLAHAIHARSNRRGRPLIAVNCAALPPTLIESELFGHEKGAFTGATQARPGRFDLADGSTLFLDEIGDLDPALQAKLLRVLQDGEVQRVGTPRSYKVDVRLVAATNRDLAAAMREGRFRADLYYRLGAFPIQVPPLRERRDDIPLLVWHFIQSRQRALGRHVAHIAPEDMAALRAYDWPGNVRELQNVMDRALILSSGSTLRLQDAFSPAAPAPSSASSASTPTRLRDAERAHIKDALERCHWIVEGPGQAAERLGLRPSTLRNRMKMLGLRRPATGARGDG